MIFDPMYLVFVGPGLLLALVATVMTQTTFGRYSRVRAASGMTGAEAAARLLETQGVRDVRIERVNGFLGDHYDPTSRTLRLSPGVYGSPSLAAVGVACHEAGHALQHAEGYGPLWLRSALVPLTQFSSNASYWLILLGFVMGMLPLVKAGVILFGLVVLFSVVTLPVEWDATARAKGLMVRAGIVGYEEQAQAGAVLNAAFLTYVASALTAALTMLYYLMRSGLLGRRD